MSDPRYYRGLSDDDRRKLRRESALRSRPRLDAGAPPAGAHTEGDVGGQEAPAAPPVSERVAMNAEESRDLGDAEQPVVHATKIPEAPMPTPIDEPTPIHASVCADLGPVVAIPVYPLPSFTDEQS